ncbi:hypothetical protein, conserved [Plasmodium gonderi]|uniref:2-C-methyl-D-erythritol 4-phosphate cytidylyltransferase n=1 Tax=Plasmodium gonderi TaxID=77519 RepID=A0A1Y1JD14_PLAGO|nr:hypothetical protein, conserved [Plasmodium gonderi]GAW79107.1 hypothetical protein, conserved [Plasmodium gonderi]
MNTVPLIIQCILIIYLIKLNGYYLCILRRQGISTFSNVKRTHCARCFNVINVLSRMDVSFSSYRFRHRRNVPVVKRKKVNFMYFIFTNFGDNKRGYSAYTHGATCKVCYFSPEHVQVKLFEKIGKKIKNKRQRSSIFSSSSSNDNIGGKNLRGADINCPDVTAEYNPQLEESEKRLGYNTKEGKKYKKLLNRLNIHAVLLCGGIGKRTELASGKQFLMLNDIPVFIYSFNLFVKCNFVKSISIVCDSNFFNNIIGSINMYNISLLKKKHQMGFLHKGHSKQVKNMLNLEQQKKDIIIHKDNTDRDVFTCLQFLKINKYIIYDNEKGKCITHLDELLNDVMKKKKLQYESELEKEMSNYVVKKKDSTELTKREAIFDLIKTSDIDANRYKLIRLLDRGKERVDSLLNALESLDLGINNQDYIFQLLQDYWGKVRKMGHIEKSDDAEEVSHGGEVEKETEQLNPTKNRYISHIMVHDGARPFLSEFDFFNLIYMSSIGKNMILGAGATDTIKLIDNSVGIGSCHRLKKNIDRKLIFLAHTPQIFKSQELLRIRLHLVQPSNVNEEIMGEEEEEGLNSSSRCSYRDKMHDREISRGVLSFTDTSSLYQYFTKKKVYTLQEKFPNFKITTPTDVFLAFLLMEHIFTNSYGDMDTRIFKQDFINSHSSYVLTNQYNDFFFYSLLDEKQKILYRHFYYQ